MIEKAARWCTHSCCAPDCRRPSAEPLYGYTVVLNRNHIHGHGKVSVPKCAIRRARDCDGQAGRLRGYEVKQTSRCCSVSMDGAVWMCRGGAGRAHALRASCTPPRRWP